MKQSFVILLCLFILVSFASCARGANKNDPAESLPAGAQGTDDVQSDSIDYTLALKNDALTTEDDRVTVILTGKTPGKTIIRSDKWRLIRVDGDKRSTLGGVYWEIAVEMQAPDAKTPASQEVTLKFSQLTDTKSAALEPGTYCIEHIGDRGEVFARLTFTVREK